MGLSRRQVSVEQTVISALLRIAIGARCRALCDVNYFFSVLDKGLMMA